MEDSLGWGADDNCGPFGWGWGHSCCNLCNIYRSRTYAKILMNTRPRNPTNKVSMEFQALWSKILFSILTSLMSTTPPEAIGKAVVVALPNMKCYEFSFPEFPRFMVID